MSSEYLWDPRDREAPRDADVERFERLLARYRHVEHGTPRWMDGRKTWSRLVPWAVAAAAALVLALVLMREDEASYRVHGLADRERIRAGELLENLTGGDVRLEIAALGHVDVASGSKLRIETCAPDRHGLYLERGRVHALILARPRTFQIDTPAGLTVDLGCEYDLEVDATGAASVHVHSGQIEFMLDGREVYVPAHASCTSRPGVGPSPPMFEDASGALSDVLAIALGAKSLSVKDPEGVLTGLLAECTDEDTLTLWHLYDSTAVDATLRELLFERLKRQFPLPEGVDETGLDRGDRVQRRAWRDSMHSAWRFVRAGDGRR